MSKTLEELSDEVLELRKRLEVLEQQGKVPPTLRVSSSLDAPTGPQEPFQE